MDSSGLWAVLFLGLVAAGCSATDVSLNSADVGNWTVGDCILAEFAMTFTIHPNKTDPKFNSTITVPASAMPDKSQTNCGNETQLLTLSWSDISVNKTLLPRNITVAFTVVNGTEYGIKRIYGTFYMAEWNETITKNDTNSTVTRHTYLTVDTFDRKPPMLRIPLKRSYLCADPGPFRLTTFLKDDIPGSPPGGTNLTATIIHAKHVRFDAFRGPDAPKGPNYQIPLDCAYRPNDIVPIAVGCALAALVVIVLVAYLVGRRRAKQRGYQSV